jgi:hypothetical protein
MVVVVGISSTTMVKVQVVVRVMEPSVEAASSSASSVM